MQFFNSKADLRKHMDQAHTFHCMKCADKSGAAKLFNTKRALQAHNKAKHSAAAV